MAIKHNQKIVKTHLRKDWQRYVRCHFDQAGNKSRRRAARRTKAALVAPRPTDRLRPVVRCPTIKYNRHVRLGRGFSLTELKAAGIPRLQAATIGIAVDGRRQNLSEESLAANVERLKAYKARLILLPRGKAKKGETKFSELAKVDTSSTVAAVLPITRSVPGVTEIKKSAMPAAVEGGAYRKLRIARSDARLVGVREKRAKEKAEAEAAKK